MFHILYIMGNDGRYSTQYTPSLMMIDTFFTFFSIHYIHF